MMLPFLMSPDKTQLIPIGKVVIDRLWKNFRAKCKLLKKISATLGG